MGSVLSTIIFQPLLLGIAAAMLVVALIYQNKSTKCGDKTDKWGANIFNINVGIAVAIIITAILINFISGLEI